MCAAERWPAVDCVHACVQVHEYIARGVGVPMDRVWVALSVCGFAIPFGRGLCVLPTMQLWVSGDKGKAAQKTCLLVATLFVF